MKPDNAFNVGALSTDSIDIEPRDDVGLSLGPSALPSPSNRFVTNVNAVSAAQPKTEVDVAAALLFLARQVGQLVALLRGTLDTAATIPEVAARKAGHRREAVWLTYKEAAAYMSWSVGRLRNMVSARQIPVYGSKRSRRFRRDMLDAFLSDPDVAMRKFRLERERA